MRQRNDTVNGLGPDITLTTLGATLSASATENQHIHRLLSDIANSQKILVSQHSLEPAG